MEDLPMTWDAVFGDYFRMADNLEVIASIPPSTLFLDPSCSKIYS